METDRFVSVGLVYSGVLFLATSLLSDPTTLDPQSTYFLTVGLVFVTGGLYRLARGGGGRSVPEPYERVVTFGFSLLLVALTALFAVSVYGSVTSSVPF